jgi:hypothetical protein
MIGLPNQSAQCNQNLKTIKNEPKGWPAHFETWLMGQKLGRHERRFKSTHQKRICL